MTSTAMLAPRAQAAPAVEPPVGAVESVVEPDVLGLDAVGTLGFVVERRRRADAAAAEELRAVTHWADLHRVGPDALGAVDPEIGDAILRRQIGQGPAASPGLLGLEGELRLAGQGAFGVEEFAVAELAAALNLSEPAGRAYVGQAVELRDRLPLCWDRVMAGQLPAWKARQVADRTIPLTGDAAGWVDVHLAPYAHRLSVTRIVAAVDAAVLRFDPEEAARRADAAAEKRGVWCEDRLDGTTTITAVADAPDAVAFDTALDTVASTLGQLGDPDPLRVRRARALGILADPQYALTLLTGPAGSDSQAPSTRSTHRGTHGPVIHVHVHTEAVTGVSGGLGSGFAGGSGQVARVTGVLNPGPRSLAAVERWLAGLRPDAVVKVTPVVDLTEHWSVDAYEVPPRIADQVGHRDLTCRFPWCNRTRSLDADHVQPYEFGHPDDPGGGRPPPGQTAMSNLAQLCRFHHRLKTHGGWSYTLTHDTVCTWTSPLGRRYSVDENGTRPLT